MADRWSAVGTLKRSPNFNDLEQLLLALVDDTELKNVPQGHGVVPAAYRELAILYRRLKRLNDEIGILERFARQPHEPGVVPPQLLARLEKLTAKARAGGQGTRIRSTRLAELPIGDATTIDLGEGRGFTVGIVGESYRQAALRNLSQGRRERGEQVHFVVEVLPEPDNAYDANAIRVEILGGKHVGHLSREDAAEYAAVLEALKASGRRGICRAKLIGGTGSRPSFGVMIDLAAPETLAERVSGQPF